MIFKLKCIDCGNERQTEGTEGNYPVAYCCGREMKRKQPQPKYIVDVRSEGGGHVSASFRTYKEAIAYQEKMGFVYGLDAELR